MHGLAAEKNRQAHRDLALGPLTYRLVAHDAWGEQLLASLNACLDMSGGCPVDPDRTIHLCALHQEADNCRDERHLPAELAVWLPDGEHEGAWSYRRNLVNTVWWSPRSRHSFWTAGIAPDLGQFRYHLPWDLLLHDMQALGGGLIHGGLVNHQTSALLLLAPPGGGKTTTLMTARTNWQVLSDDAALIWPLGVRTWQASPLPSWGMLNRTTSGPTEDLRRLDNSVPVRVIIRLYQAPELDLTPVRPVKASPLIYRALCEYPAAFLADPEFRPYFFRTAAVLARELPCWRLDLPLHADVWPRLGALMERPRR